MEAYKKKLLETWEELPPMFITSSEKKDGRDDVLNYIEQINNSLKEG
jgi:GTP-binding protein